MSPLGVDFGYMRPEEKLHRAIWSTLDEITQEKLATPDDEWVLVSCHSPERKRAIQALGKCGAIKVVKSKFRPLTMTLRMLQDVQGIEEEVVGYFVDIIEPRYTELLDFYYDNIGKSEGSLLKSDVTRVTNQLKLWQGSKPNPVQPEKITNSRTETPEKKIEKLTIVEKPKHEPKLTVVVNDDYLKPLHFDTNKPTGGFLLKLEEERAGLSYAEHKPSFDYLNSAESQLVTKTGCTKTKILTSEAGYITPTIDIEKITERAFRQRSGKTPKNT